MAATTTLIMAVDIVDPQAFSAIYARRGQCRCRECTMAKSPPLSYERGGRRPGAGGHATFRGVNGLHLGPANTVVVGLPTHQ